MTLRIDIHRFTRVAVAIALATAVVGLACLMPAVAMAGPSHGMEQPARDCDSGGPIGFCPHEKGSMAVATAAVAEHAQITFALPPVGIVGTAPEVISAAPAPITVSPPDSGSPTPVPLRL